MSTSRSFMLRIRNIEQLVVVETNKKLFKCGKDMDHVDIIPNGTVIVNNNGVIVDIGPDSLLFDKYIDTSFEKDLDGKGMCVLPGLVDGHTHPVWAGDRVHEFAMKLAGATYLDIHKAGGGIGFTVEHTRNATEAQLQALLKTRLDRMIKFGTTLAEAKSGYGLDFDTEVKMLKVIKNASDHPVELVSTYLGAHSVPKGSTAQQYSKEIVDTYLPKIKELKDKGEIDPQNIDVFYEKGVFEHAESRAILEAGKKHGFEINFHGDELNAMGCAEVGGELGALAISHLEKVSDEGIKQMAKKPTFAVLLPTTAYILRLEPPPARKLIENNVPVALGSDFNPNAHCLAMPLVMNQACVLMRMTMNEVLVAATLNAAASLRRSDTHGSLETGKFGDMIVLAAPKWEHIVYQLADPPIKYVIKKGKIVYEA
eukprot:Phypoly_transcript_01393.p1 GENE.Phypoly_transcript_01393~~Phypoly_transcript_01393.p1  ORF type:complete len:426 (+),score=73.98 Phypoly_transcript_01393:1967-3244(+)